NDLIVHEWGTFTSKFSTTGVPYQDLHKTIDEPVPDFVYHINFDTIYEIGREYNKGYERDTGRLDLQDVSIKMETPVLYFYSAKAIEELRVQVEFPKGSISEYYPLPFVREDTNYVKRHTRNANSRYGKASLSFIDYKGYAKWNINVLAPDDLIPLTYVDEEVPKLWSAPRKTKANKIECNGEVEKYIFYRGLASFETQIQPSYTYSGNLLVKNQGLAIKYAIVYEKTPEGERFIWGVNSIPENGLITFEPSKVSISDADWTNGYRQGFVSSLIDAGLYRDEAEAMLNTWDESYFGKPGIKIFWIVPRSFTDEILPISFSESVVDLQRVMVGRTEIDPYKINERQLYKADVEQKSVVDTYQFFPNPANGQITITSSKNINEQVNVEIFDILGRPLLKQSINVAPIQGGTLDIRNISTGIYTLKIQEGEVQSKLVVQ
ncbi:MAG: hypothetical protein ACI9UJ_001810, partial [bacterium]